MTTSGVDQFQKKMNDLAVVYGRSASDCAKASASVYTAAIRRGIGGATSGNKLRGVGKKGARVGVRYDIKEKGDTATAFVRATGPLHLLERDNADHDVPRTKTSRRLRTASGRLSAKRVAGTRSRDGRIPLRINGNWITGPVHVRGSKGKHVFERAVNRVEREAVAYAAANLTRSIANIFKG